MFGEGSPNALAFGQNGAQRINDTTPVTGKTWGIIQALTDTVIATLVTANVRTGVDSWTGSKTTITLNAGHCLYGRFTGLTLTSGDVLCYNA